MQNLVNYALAYQKKGLSVLPIMNKRPLIQFADKPPLTAEEIKKIWQKHPTASIALRTKDFFVVDIDQHEHGDNGFESFNKLPADWFPATLTQRTKNGGKQLFYLKREDLKIKQLIAWHPGIDIKAHPNNYVVVAPSEGYVWENKLPILTAPKALVTAIDQAKLTQGRTERFDGATGGKWERNATTEMFEMIATGLGGQGQRNKMLASLSGGLLFRAVNPSIAYKLVCIANQNSVDPLPQAEVERTFESILKRDMRG